MSPLASQNMCITFPKIKLAKYTLSYWINVRQLKRLLTICLEFIKRLIYSGKWNWKSNKRQIGFSITSKQFQFNSIRYRYQLQGNCGIKSFNLHRLNWLLDNSPSFHSFSYPFKIYNTIFPHIAFLRNYTGTNLWNILRHMRFKAAIHQHGNLDVENYISHRFIDICTDPEISPRFSAFTKRGQRITFHKYNNKSISAVINFT